MLCLAFSAGRDRDVLLRRVCRAHLVRACFSWACKRCILLRWSLCQMRTLHLCFCRRQRVVSVKAPSWLSHDSRRWKRPLHLSEQHACKAAGCKASFRLCIPSQKCHEQTPRPCCAAQVASMLIDSSATPCGRPLQHQGPCPDACICWCPSQTPSVERTSDSRASCAYRKALIGLFLAQAA